MLNKKISLLVIEMSKHLFLGIIRAAQTQLMGTPIFWIDKLVLIQASIKFVWIFNDIIIYK